MAMYQMKITFDGRPPELDEVADRERKNTGLDIGLDYFDEDRALINHPDFKQAIEIEKEENSINVYLMPPRFGYLGWNCIIAATELGGTYSGPEPPESMRKRWEDVPAWKRIFAK